MYPYYTASLVVTAGTLVNAAGGTISASTPFADAPRYLTAQLDNQGTLTTSGPLVLNAASAQHTNEGTINVSGGDLTVSQSGTNPSFTNSGTITIGSGRTLQFNGGGTFSGTIEAIGGGSLTMTTPPTNLASGTLTGATWVVGANSSMSLGANITTDAATIVLDGAGADFSSLSPLTQIASGGSLEILDGGSFTTAGDLDNAGTIDLAPGTLNIAGNYTQESSGAYDVAVGGLVAGSQFGQLNATNQATLNGALGVSLINNYVPPQGDSYPVLTFGSKSGDFSAEFGLYFGGGTGFTPTFNPGTNPTELDLVVISESPGTQTTVQSSENPSNYGHLVTFTADVTPAVSTNMIPTGTVTFYDGATAIDTATLVDGSASFTTSALAAGQHPIVVQYSGDPNFSGSNSAGLPQVVNQDASTTAVASSVNPTVFGQSVTFTATVASAVSGVGTPTGQVIFYDGTTAIDTETLVNGVASYTTSSLAVAGHSITAKYAGDTNFSGSTSTAFTQAVDQASTTTGVTTSVNPSAWGQGVTFTATVSVVSPGSGTPTGTVSFYDGTTTIDTVNLNGGTASYTTSALSVSGHSITARYAPSTAFGGSTSTAITQTVDQDGSATSLATSNNPGVLGQPVTFTATVTAAAPGSGTPTGTVTFYDGTQAIDSETLVGGTAEFTTSSLALGDHAITAVYGSDSDFTGSTSATISETVKQASATTAVASSVNPTVFGQSVTFTATVSATPPGTGTPTGQVTFYDGTSPIDTENLINGTASYSTAALAVGGHSITAEYSGDTDFIGGTSTAITQTVDQDGTTTAVASSLNPSNVGDPVTFTATVSANAPGSGTPGGQVTFYDGTQAIDTANLAGGTASYTTSALTLGDHSITAQYSPSTDFAGSTSTAITQTVEGVPPATLDGEIYNDPNDSGTPASGAGLSGWTVTLLSGTTPVATTTTDSNGDYSFTNVVPGSYTISVAEQSGYAPTLPSSGTLPVSAGPGQTIGNLNFGEFQTVTVSGEVFNDVNDNGTIEPNDPGLSGWTVKLLNGADQVVQTTTDHNGDYSFIGVGPGTYTVAEVLQSGYAETTSPSTYSLTTTGGQDVIGLDFGNFQQWSVSGTLFEDSNQDGSLDGGETGLSGWTVNLSNGSNQVVASATTDSQGNYSFNSLPAGNYTIQEVLQTGYIATVPGSGGITLTPTSGAQISGENVGVFKAVSLSVTGLATSPSSLQSGSSVVVNWSDTNTGTLAAVGSFTDLVTITNSTTGQVLATASVPYDATTLGNLAAGASAPMQYNFRIPDSTPGVGQILFVVTTDVNNQVSTPQGDPARTAMVSESSTLTTPTLTLTLDRSAVSDAAAADAATATVTRNGGLDTDLVVTLASNDLSAATVPLTVTIPAGQASSTFPVDAVDDGLVDGDQTPTLTASAAGFVPGSAVLTVTETDVPTLTLVLDTTTVEEGGSVTGSVERNWITAAPLAVTFSASTAGRMTLPVVIIPANQSSSTFTVGTVYNSAPQKDQTFTLTAASGGFVGGTAALTITDESNLPTLTLSPTTGQVVENGAGITFTVTRAVAVDTPLTVKLFTSDANLAVPAVDSVIIPAYETSATFLVNPVENHWRRGRSRSRSRPMVPTSRAAARSSRVPARRRSR